MALLLLVRHGATDATGKVLTGTAPGVHLSEAGRRQAAALAERLAGLRVDAVHSSPLERCLETAEPIAASHRLPVLPLDEVREVGYGRWTNRPLAQLRRTRLWGQVHAQPSAVRFPDGEGMAEAQQRMVAALTGLAARHPKGRLVVVTHADPIRMAVAHFAGVHLDLFQRFVVSPASITAVALGAGPPRVLKVNDTGDLADLAPPPRRSNRPPAGRRKSLG
jgi:probable phosphoglycerate mutase